MTRKLRSLHFWIWVLLAVGLTMIFVASIALRHPEPINDSVPLRIAQER